MRKWSWMMGAFVSGALMLPACEDSQPKTQPKPQIVQVQPAPKIETGKPIVEAKVEAKPQPSVQPKVEAKIEPEPQEKVELPPAPVPPVAALAPPETVEPPPVTPPEPTVTAPPSDTPPAPATTAPAREHHASVAETNKWHRDIVAQIERHKSYPPAARARGQKGVVQVAFSIDKDGRLVASRVAQASGHALLDEAAMAALQTSQFPPAPSGTPGNEFSFTVPIEFKLR